MAESDIDTKNRTNLKNWVVAYRTVGDVLYSLGEIAKGGKIEDEEQLANLQRAVDTLLGDKSKDVSKNAKELLEVLSGMDSSEEIEVESEENEDKMESRVPDNLEELVAEYELALKEKDEARRIRLERAIVKKTGMGVEEYITRLKEMAREAKEGVVETEEERTVKSEPVAEEKKADFVPKAEATENPKDDLGIEPKPEIREVLLASGISEVDAEKMMAKIREESAREKVDMQRVRVEAGRMAISNRLDERAVDRIVQTVEEKVATVRLEKEAEIIAVGFAAEMEAGGIRTDKKNLAEEIMACWRGNESLEMRKTVPKIGQTEGEIEETATAVAIRKADQRVIAMAENNRGAVETVRLKEVREEIIRSIGTADKDGKEKVEAVENYARFVTDIYKDNPVSKYRVRVMMESPLRPGATERGFNRTEVLVDLIGRGGMEERIRQFGEFRGLIKNFGASDKVDASRTVNELFRWLQHDPEAVFQIEAVRNRIAWAQNWGDKIIGIFKPGGIDNLFLDVSQKIVNQPFFQFVNETSILMSGGKSFSEALGITLKSLITNGKVVAGAAAKEGAAAAAGTVAAAGTAGARAVATVLSGPLAPVVAVVAAAATVVIPVVKKIGKAVFGFLERMGLTLGIKKWMKEKFGKLGGWVMGAGMVVGTAFLGIGGILTATLAGVTGIAMVVLAPILLIVALMLFLAGPMVSSVVPPVNLGAGMEAEYDPTAPPLVAGKIEKCANGKTNASVEERVDMKIKQNEGPWADMLLPGGCKFRNKGCGPVAASKILIKKDKDLTPDYLVYEPGSAYSTMGCDGSSLSQAELTIEKHMGKVVTRESSTMICNKQSIADWICQDKIVMVLANFYANDELRLVGHYFLAVEYKNGEIYSADPIFEDGAVLDGEAKAGHVQAIRECMTID